MKSNFNYKKYLALLLALLVMVSAILPCMPAKAATIKVATLTGDLTIRELPDKDSKSLGTVKKDQSFTILEEAQDNRTPPVTWYKITANNVTGWISSAYVEVKEVEETPKPEYTPDADFEKYLKDAGFPDSYKESLRKLHAEYPNWVFEVQQTGLTWEEVIAEEYELGRNMVYTTSITSWKSTQDGAYNWATGKWVGLDGSSWVAASKEIIEYYMDPRNFLDSENVFQFLKQSYDPTTMTEEKIAEKKAALELMVKGSFLEGTYKEGKKTIKYVDTLMDAGAQSGVCPLTLASMIIQEQGRQGTGKSISGTVAGYEGYYNFFNIGAYAANGLTAVQRGLWYAGGSGSGATSYNRPWNTITKSIIGGSMYYGKNYVAKGQDTMYLKKYNVQGSNMYDHQYMTNVQGAASEGQHVADGYSAESRTAALVFKIPVFKDMPSTPPTKPTANKDPNYMLKSLSVKGYSLTPTFDIFETTYATTVPNGVDKVEISATTVSEKTTVSGLGTKELAVGTNTFKIKTKAENGKKRTYKLTIIRKEAIASEPVSIKSDTYAINKENTITGIKKFPVEVTKFLKGIAVSNGTVKMFGADGKEASGNVGTGMQVKAYDTDVKCKYTYDVIIYGDVNGDGVINAKDLLTIQKNNIKLTKLKGAYLIAADVNRDGNVNARDLLTVQKNNIKLSVIEQ